jgi:hypothetical protein
MTTITGTYNENHHTFLVISHSVLLRMRNLSQIIGRENQSKDFMFTNLFSESPAFYETRGKIWRA